MLSFVSKFRVPHPQQYFPVLSCFSIMEKFDISPVAPAAAAAAAAPAAPAGLILNVTYFSCLFMSNMSPIALFPAMDLACVPLASFGFSFLVVIEIGSLARFTCFSNVDLCVSVPLQITLGALCIMLLVRRILSNC